MTELIEAATAARNLAYAPYSGYHVGAAVRSVQGEIFSGCNVENVSYGATICAERVAITKMVAAGHRGITELAVVTKDGGTPCGICLQVLAEFAANEDETKVFVVDEKGVVTTYRLSDLFPCGFASSNVGRTEVK